MTTFPVPPVENRWIRYMYTAPEILIKCNALFKIQNGKFYYNYTFWIGERILSLIKG